MLTLGQIIAIVQLLIAFDVDPATTANVRAILEAQNTTSSQVITTPMTTSSTVPMGGTSAPIEAPSMRVISWVFGTDKKGAYVDIISDTELDTVTVKTASSTEIFSGAATLNNKYSDGNYHYVDRFATTSIPFLLELKAKNGATFSASK